MYGLCNPVKRVFALSVFVLVRFITNASLYRNAAIVLKMLSTVLLPVLLILTVILVLLILLLLLLCSYCCSPMVREPDQTGRASNNVSLHLK